MPGYILYVMCFLPWAVLAVVVWAAACVMYFLGHPVARPLGFAMAATFPAVFLYQIVGLAIDAVILLLAIFVQSLHTTIGDVVFPWILLQTVIVMFVVSLLGFREGWKVGWAWGRGSALSDVLMKSSLRVILRFCPSRFCLKTGKFRDKV
jgi:hypothetical protein